MKSWKEGLEKGVNVNSMMDQYDKMLRMIQADNKDLMRKNKSMHAALYGAHAALKELLETEEVPIRAEIELILETMEAKISQGLEENEIVSAP